MFNVACGIIQTININELIHLGVCSPCCQQTLAGQKHAIGKTQTCQDPSSLLIHFSKCTVKPQLEVIATTQSSTVYCKSSLRPSRKSNVLSWIMLWSRGWYVWLLYDCILTQHRKRLRVFSLKVVANARLYTVKRL